MTDISSTTVGEYPVIGTGVVAPGPFRPGGEDLGTDIPRVAVGFDGDAFDAALYEHGVAMLHYRAMRCPVGMISVSDIRKAHEDHPGCSHGFLYTFGGLFHGVFTSQSTEKSESGLGAALSGNAQVTAPRFYSDRDTPLHVGLYDRIYLAQRGMTVVNWQLFTVGEGDVDRLDFPAETVVDLVDSDGRVYSPEVDFTLVNGRVRWGSGARPRTGMVCAARYLYRPYWYVRYMPHELRIARVDDGSVGEPAMQRMPQALTLQREWLFESELARQPAEALTAPVSARQPQPAATGPNFGSR